MMILPEATNKTEEQLIRIFHDDKLSKASKISLIEDLSYTTDYQCVDRYAGSSCAICSPPHTTPAFVDNVIRSLDKRYKVVIFLAAVKTPLNLSNGKPHLINGKRKTSAAGHMWYQISDFETEKSYGFAPIHPEDGGAQPMGPGEVTNDDVIIYENPHYARHLEITEAQFMQLKNYGNSAMERNNPDFDLYYNGITNSCIDFTWHALNSAELYSLDKRKKPNKDFEGEIKVLPNKKRIRTIKPPFPSSNLNKEKINPEPHVSYTDLKSILLGDNNKPDESMRST